MVHLENSQEIVPVMSARVAYNSIKKSKMNGKEVASLSKKKLHKKEKKASKNKKCQEIVESVKLSTNNVEKETKKVKKKGSESFESKSVAQTINKKKKNISETEIPATLHLNNHKKNAESLLEELRSGLNKDNLLKSLDKQSIVPDKKNNKKSKKRKLEDCPPTLVNLKVLKTKDPVENGKLNVEQKIKKKEKIIDETDIYGTLLLNKNKNHAESLLEGLHSGLNKDNLLRTLDKQSIVSGKKNNKKSKKRKLEDCPPTLVNLKVLKTKDPVKNGVMSIDCQSNDSSELGAAQFNYLISPIPNDQFFKQYWEKKTLYLKRQKKNYYSGLFSTKTFNNLLNTRNIQFTKNLDLASYKDGKRETHNPEGRALAPVVWDHFNNGCSVRLLNPQTFHKPVWCLLATLQEYFQSFCGANVYLTPPGTQGFAPHWDDIEAFILQLEGKKKWRVYSPRAEDETLPRESSKNFGPEDDLGTPVLDVILEPGDLLYFPRGFIHQGVALEDIHSLHITFSTYQKTTWVDFLEKLLPAALSNAAEKDVEFRKGLPLGYGNAGGVIFSDVKSTFKEQFKKNVSVLVDKLIEYAPVDDAIDQMMKGFIHDSLPPILEEEEKECSVYGGGERWNDSLKKVLNRVEMAPDSKIRLLRKECVRLVIEENSIRLFHSVDNSREYHAEEPKYVELGIEMGPGIEAIIRSYPEYMKVEDLPLESLTDKLTLAMGLWEKGLITTDEPLVNEFDD